MDLLHAAVLSRRFGTPFAVNSRRNNAAGIAGTLTAGEETAQADVLQGIALAYDADRRRRACLYGYHHGIVGQEAAGVTAELPEAFVRNCTS